MPDTALYSQTEQPEARKLKLFGDNIFRVERPIMMIMIGGSSRENAGSQDRMSPPNNTKEDWRWIRSRAVDAVNGLIEYEEPTLNLEDFANKPLQLPSSELLKVDRPHPLPPFQWSGQTFFLEEVKAARTGTPRRCRVHLRFTPTQRQVVVKVTQKARQALRGATRVRVKYCDTSLLDHLRGRLCEMRRGPRLPDLWSAQTLSPAPDVDGLNTDQAQAFHAMTTEGGWLIWGPRSTGKTTVIVKAIEASMAAGRSVLIAAHTHSAVDKVVKQMADVVSGPGQIVRVGRPEKIDQTVREHDWLLLDKAAAVLTDRAAALQEILEEQAANSSDPARGELDSIVDRLRDWDIPLIEQAYKAQGDADEAVRLAADWEPTVENIARLHREIGQLSEQSDAEKTVANTLPKRQLDVASAAKQYHELTQRIATIESTLAEQDNNGDEEMAAIDENRAELERLRGSLDSVNAHAAENKRRFALARNAFRRRQECRETIAELRQTLQEDELWLEKFPENMELYRTAAEAVPNYEDVIRSAKAVGALDLIDEMKRLEKRVHELDAELKQLRNEQGQIEDECIEARKHLLKSAPVIASTLATLTTSNDLANRRFDTVIVNDAASTYVSQLVYAGSKADRGFAFVGDFMQNSPITDIGDGVTEEEQQLRRWQRDDVFALLGIRDRAKAEAHSRCVVLRTQYGYPKIIADIVNEFCYAGLLETLWSGKIDSPVITFVDTSKHPEQGLHRDGTSWWHPLGLKIMDGLCQNRDRTQSMGLVCPYSAHADRASSLSKLKGFDVPCGTSHRLQGRQFDTVIFDLMQDNGREHWAAQAALNGERRQVAAAKLLNAALTLTRGRLFIIGDWEFLGRRQTPGMRAIRNARYRREFEVVAAETLIG